MNALSKSLLLCLFILFSLSAASQLRFIVQNGESSVVYGTFDAAIGEIRHGDTLYLPGGSFNIGTITLSKKITILGAGHYPAYAQATGRTEMSGNIILVTGADTSQFHGFYLSGNIHFGNSIASSKVTNITISRCNLNSIILKYGNNNSQAEQILITENVIRGVITGGNAQNVLIERNIVVNINEFNNNVLITNNVILNTSGNPTLEYIYSCTIRNNVLVHAGGYLFYESSANTVAHNLFVNTYEIGTNNIDEQPLASIFVNYTGGAFSYDQDFHLQESSPGNNAGTDGTDIGIYGTETPYKEGAVPFTPHVTSENIATKTNTEGKLNVQVTVEAQTK